MAKSETSTGLNRHVSRILGGLWDAGVWKDEAVADRFRAMGGDACRSTVTYWRLGTNPAPLAVLVGAASLWTAEEAADGARVLLSTLLPNHPQVRVVVDEPVQADGTVETVALEALEAAGQMVQEVARDLPDGLNAAELTRILETADRVETLIAHLRAKAVEKGTLRTVGGRK